MTNLAISETDLAIGPSALSAYSRLSYTMWHALAEFIDNSTQSYINYQSILDEVLRTEQQPLTIEITHQRVNKTITISDNSIGMTKDDLINALKVAVPTQDSKGRSKYGMGMKTAACWIGRKWDVITTEWDSGIEWTAHVDVNAIANHNKKVTLTPKEVDKASHYTKIVIHDMYRHIQGRTEENIRSYLGSMYRFDIGENKLQILYNNQPVTPPDDYDFDTDTTGQLLKREFNGLDVNGKKVSGWVAVLRRGGRKFGGFSLFQERRQIQGFPNAWKPRKLFGGVDDEGANNLVAQRLVGVLQLEGFKVSHTKDTILFDDNEEELLEDFLDTFTKDYRAYATKRRNAGGNPWSKDKVKELVEGLKREFDSPEMRDAVRSTVLPPISTIIQNNEKQLGQLQVSEAIATFNIIDDLTVRVFLSEKSEFEPYVTIQAAAEPATMYILINVLHPYYCALESTDAINECLRQYVYDAIAEYRITQQSSPVIPPSVRRMKDSLLRAPTNAIENAVATAQTDGQQPDEPAK